MPSGIPRSLQAQTNDGMISSVVAQRLACAGHALATPTVCPENAPAPLAQIPVFTRALFFGIACAEHWE